MVEMLYLFRIFIKFDICKSIVNNNAIIDFVKYKNQFDFLEYVNSLPNTVTVYCYV